MIRYPSSKESFKNICSETNKDPNCSPIIKLAQPWQGMISEADTIPELSLRLLATPFAIAADILLLPLNAVIMFMAGVGAKREATKEPSEKVSSDK